MKTAMHLAFTSVEMIHNYRWVSLWRYELFLGRTGQWINLLSANPKSKVHRAVQSSPQGIKVAGYKKMFLQVFGMNLEQICFSINLFFSLNEIIQHQTCYWYSGTGCCKVNLFNLFQSSAYFAYCLYSSFRCLDLVEFQLILIYTSLTFFIFLLQSCLFRKCCL